MFTIVWFTFLEVARFIEKLFVLCKSRYKKPYPWLQKLNSGLSTSLTQVILKFCFSQPLLLRIVSITFLLGTNGVQTFVEEHQWVAVLQCYFKMAKSSVYLYQSTIGIKRQCHCTDCLADIQHAIKWDQALCIVTLSKCYLSIQTVNDARIQKLNGTGVTCMA